MVRPALLLNVVQVDITTRERITVSCGKNTPPSQLESVLDAQLVVVLGVQHTVSKRLTTADAEEVAGHTGAVAVDVVQRRSLLRGDAGTHGAHAEAHALVAVDEVGEDLGGSGDADTALVTELVKAALHAQPAEPVLAVCSATSKGSEQDAVDLDDLLDGLRGNPVTGRGTRVGSDDDAALESEGQGRCSVGNLDGAVRVGSIIGGSSEPL